MMDEDRVRCALISVTDKTGIVEFARALQTEFGVRIVSTGGTARVLEEAGIAVLPIDELTGFPEMMDGRVKTLHPRVHGGLLARRDNPAHLAQAIEQGIDLIDMVVVNLYAFEATVAREGVSYEEAIENIDIGGPSMLRSAAKNHASVAVLTSPAHYDVILEELRANDGATTRATRQRLAREVYELTSAYDNAIYQWLTLEINREQGSEAPPVSALGQGPVPDDLRLFLTKAADLRYGENPHQTAAFYRPASEIGASGCPFHPVEPSFQLARARQLQGKALSYNNYLDLDAAWTAVREFSEPTCVIVKHLTPCGLASNPDIVTAYQHAHDADPVSAFGGVMAFNVPVPAALVEAVYAKGQFIEAIIAPAYDPMAVQLLTEKPNARVLETGGINPPGGVDYRSIEGGLLAMASDTVEENSADFVVPTRREPTEAERASLLFAWRACKSVKSNAIVIASATLGAGAGFDGGFALLGAGAGQPNRMNSAELAVRQAGEKAQGAVAASDAFMPFADSLEVLAAAGVTAIIQPGGSVRDAEVIAAADALGVALLFTGHRHFRH
ncbi:MAG: bifunctional phosphoribosylaminoimidazolecarboxamide formyltransferase/IMP cyclohydrolase [Coriobacteriales bacterium]|jgi:phosphoribosylaminoimidazolecarboxamide formyltransferase/IMP cyclohydrolase|nr:bifunctional phosphoribosylaminoimidazolecarboxamide formyltransferase/IMP cyclohydrolase [Coriobacteriales bacterium]